MREGHTELVVILDRSGSMSGIANDMKGGFDKLIDEQNAQPGTCAVTLVQFDGGVVDVVYEEKPVNKVPKLVLVPRGSTNLLDAVGETIDRIGQRLAETPESQRPEKVVVLIITDGEENASREYTRGMVRKRIEHQEKEYGWQFMYLGANVDAFHESAKIGMSAINTVQYKADSASIGKTFGYMSDSLRSYRAGASATVALDDTQKADIVAP